MDKEVVVHIHKGILLTQEKEQASQVGLVVKNPPAKIEDTGDEGSIPGSGRRRKWPPTPVFLPGESQGQGSLAGVQSMVLQSQTRLKREGTRMSQF